MFIDEVCMPDVTQGSILIYFSFTLIVAGQDIS